MGAPSAGAPYGSARPRRSASCAIARWTCPTRARCPRRWSPCWTRGIPSAVRTRGACPTRPGSPGGRCRGAIELIVRRRPLVSLLVGASRGAAAPRSPNICGALRPTWPSRPPACAAALPAARIIASLRALDCGKPGVAALCLSGAPVSWGAVLSSPFRPWSCIGLRISSRFANSGKCLTSLEPRGALARGEPRPLGGETTGATFDAPDSGRIRLRSDAAAFMTIRCRIQPPCAPWPPRICSCGIGRGDCDMWKPHRPRRPPRRVSRHQNSLTRGEAAEPLSSQDRARRCPLFAGSGGFRTLRALSKLAGNDLRQRISIFHRPADAAATRVRASVACGR